MRKTFVVLLLTQLLLFAQKPNDELLFEEFIHNAYNFNFEKAQTLADSLLGGFPSSPLGFHAYSLLQTWYYLGSRDEGILKTFFLFSDSAIARFEKLENLEENPYYLFRTGEEYSFRAIMYAFDFEKLGAIWATRKAVSYFNDAVALSPEFYDAYSGPAVFGYFLSFAPSFLKAGLFFLGIETDVEKNIEAFEKTYKYGDFAKTEAAFQLAKIYSDYFFEPEKSDEFLIELLRNYPGNIFFKYQYAINNIRAENFDKAIEILSEISKCENENFVQIKAFSFFLLGEIYFYLNKFKTSAEFFEKYFENTRSINFMGYANYRCGLAYYFSGDEDSARENFLMASYGNSDNYKDEFARKRSMEILEKGFNSIDKNLILAENFVQTGNYKKAEQFLNKVENKTSTRFLLTFAETEIMLKKKSADSTLVALSRKTDNETVRFRYLYLSALSEYGKGNYEKAKEILEKLFDEGNQNNELFAKARNLLRKIKE